MFLYGVVTSDALKYIQSEVEVQATIILLEVLLKLVSHQLK